MANLGLSSTHKEIVSELNRKAEYEDIIEYLVPTGTIIAFAGDNPPNGYLECNGSSVSKEDYSDLYKVIGDHYKGTSDTEGTVEEGKFKLPDLRHRFLEGIGDSDSIGAMHSAGLPNIIGQIKVEKQSTSNNYLTNDAQTVGSGAFSVKSEAFGTKPQNQIDNSNYQGISEFNFDASKANSIYRNSSTVQPNSLIVRFCIKY